MTTPEVNMPEWLAAKIQLKTIPDAGATNEEKSRSIPEPSGWKLLCVVPDVVETFEGTGIIKADQFLRGEELATTVLFVLKVGPDAYADEDKFPSGPWCQQGDFVIVRAYAGTRFNIYGKEFRLINDDMVEAVVDDPRGVSRV